MSFNEFIDKIDIPEYNGLLEPLRGPSGKIWPIHSYKLFDYRYDYQIPIDSQAFLADDLCGFLVSKGIHLDSWTIACKETIDNIIVGFKEEPSEELVLELQLRFG